MAIKWVEAPALPTSSKPHIYKAYGVWSVDIAKAARADGHLNNLKAIRWAALKTMQEKLCKEE